MLHFDGRTERKEDELKNFIQINNTTTHLAGATWGGLGDSVLSKRTRRRKTLAASLL
jgi:hypothetical protein